MAAVAREYQQYVRTVISRNISYLDGATPAGTPQSAVQVSFGFAVPLNAIVLRIWIIVTTAFNAATTNTLDVGTAASGVSLVAAQTLAAAGVFALTAATLNGLLNSAADTEIFTRYNFTGANPTAGLGRCAVEYIVDPARRL
jgi:hypothetical protein